METALPLDGLALMNEAREQVGLHDFGDDSLAERVVALAVAMEDRGLDANTRARARDTFLWLLRDRLRLFDDAKSFETAKQDVVRPLLVTGEARCGTTFAQMWFGQDPQARRLKVRCRCRRRGSPASSDSISTGRPRSRSCRPRGSP